MEPGRWGTDEATDTDISWRKRAALMKNTSYFSRSSAELVLSVSVPHLISPTLTFTSLYYLSQLCMGMDYYYNTFCHAYTYILYLSIYYYTYKCCRHLVQHSCVHYTILYGTGHIFNPSDILINLCGFCATKIRI